MWEENTKSLNVSLSFFFLLKNIFFYPSVIDLCDSISNNFANQNDHIGRLSCQYGEKIKPEAVKVGWRHLYIESVANRLLLSSGEELDRAERPHPQDRI